MRTATSFPAHRPNCAATPGKCRRSLPDSRSPVPRDSDTRCSIARASADFPTEPATIAADPTPIARQRESRKWIDPRTTHFSAGSLGLDKAEVRGSGDHCGFS